MDFIFASNNQHKLEEVRSILGKNHQVMSLKELDFEQEIPEIINAGKKIVCGIIAKPKNTNGKYSDYINRAAKGWQYKTTLK